MKRKNGFSAIPKQGPQAVYIDQLMHREDLIRVLWHQSIIEMNQ